MTLVDAVSNVVAGFGLAVGLQLLLFPAFGLHPTIVRSLVIGARFALLACLGSEPPRVCRRPISPCHATISSVFRFA